MSRPSKHQTTAAVRRRTHELSPHREAELIPVMPEKEYEAFRLDVAARGIQVPIEITAGDVVLDGRQRLRAARELGLETVPVRVVEVEDELDYMFRAAILRRQLTASQRAALVVERDEYRELQAGARERQRANLAQATEGATSPPRGKTRDPRRPPGERRGSHRAGRCDRPEARPRALRADQARTGLGPGRRPPGPTQAAGRQAAASAAAAGGTLRAHLRRSALAARPSRQPART